MEAEDEEVHGRVRRFLYSLFLIGFIGFGMPGVYPPEHVPILMPLALFAGYLLLAAVIMTLVARQLYSQHELRVFKFDIATILLVTTLAALPLGVANGFVLINRTYLPGSGGNTPLGTQIMIVICLYGLLIPIMFASEALLVWTGKLMKRRR